MTMNSRIIQCEECGRSFPTQQSRCPECGAEHTELDTEAPDINTDPEDGNHRGEDEEGLL